MGPGFYKQEWCVAGMKKLVIGLGIAFLVALHFALLVVTPPGFFSDEAATGAHVVSMLQHGTNAHGQAWPLFSASLGGGYTTPVYLYPVVAWSALFGVSELALRSFSMFAGITTAFLLGHTIRLWLGGNAGVTATVVGLTLPWAWLQSSLAWDPALVPLVMALALWAFSVLALHKDDGGRIAAIVVLPLALVGLAYLYPPMRVGAPLLFILGYGYLLIGKHISRWTLIVTCCAAAAVSMPLAQFMLQPDVLWRSQALSVFHYMSFFRGVWQVLENFFGMLNPMFLFVEGDPNLRHATGIQGMLGLAALLPVLAVVVAVGVRMFRRRHVFSKPQAKLLVIALCGISASLLGSALTIEGQPHSLRSCAAWVFFVIVITVGWQLLAELKHWRHIWSGALLVAIGGPLFYAGDLLFDYPERSANWFDASQRSLILGGQTNDEYPALAQYYYRNR